VKTRILIADDHAVLRECLRALISAQPELEVVAEAGEQREVLWQARQTQPDIVLLDLSMPGGSGIETIRKVIAECPGVRVLVLSMHEEPSFLRAALAAGASGYVLKRSAYAQLLDALGQVRGGTMYVDPSVRLGDEDLRARAPSLSPREREVLALLAGGLSYREAGERLGMGERTVETHRRHILEKLGLKTRADLVRYALELGLIAPGVAHG
jgi:two-component system, NarL family, response regulator NreC